MELGGVDLQGRFVRMTRLDEAHREALRAVCAADQGIWTLYPYSMVGEGFDAYWDRAMGRNADGSGAIFAILKDGELVGVSGFGPDRVNQTAEIGGTYLHPDVRGGPVNPESKLLMLDHAFKQGCRRVQFRVDAMNVRSAGAMRKLGAHQDGVLRQDLVTWTGRVRDTIVFSILKDEWPEVRAGLAARVEAFLV